MPECIIIYLLKKENNYDWLYNIIVKQECQNPSSKNYINILVVNQQRYVASTNIIIIIMIIIVICIAPFIPIPQLH